jgi:hypothetical protein
MSNNTAAAVKTYKVQVTAKGVALTINGQTFELGDSKDAMLFDLERAVAGYTVPERGRIAAYPVARADGRVVNVTVPE